MSMQHTSGVARRPSPRRSRHGLALAAALGLACAGLTACGGSVSPSVDLPNSMSALVKQARSEGEVEWAVPKPIEQMQPAIDLFEKKYQGIKVKYTNTKPPDQVSQLKVEQAANKVSIDLANAGGLTVTPSVALTAKVDWSKYGVAADDVFATNFVYVWATPKVWAYNTDKVSPGDVPRSWDDLLDQRWSAGRISAESRASFLAVWDLAPSMGDKAGLTWAKKFALQKPHYAPNLTDAEVPIETGQVSIGTSLVNLVLTAKDKGAPVAVAPISPSPANETYVYIPKGAPHPAAAALLASFLSSDEAQNALAKTYNSRIPVHTDCSDKAASAVLTTICDAGLKWYPASTVAQYRQLTDLFTEGQKALGTDVS